MATQSEVAEHLDISDRTVRNLLEKKVLPASKGRGGLDLDRCRISYIQYLRQGSEPETASGSGIDLDRERELLIREQREGQALKNAEMRRELAPVGVIEWALGRVAAQLSAQLDSLVPRLKRSAPFLTAANLDQVTREVVKAKNAAARIEVDLDEYRRDSVRG